MFKQLFRVRRRLVVVVCVYALFDWCVAKHINRRTIQKALARKYSNRTARHKAL